MSPKNSKKPRWGKGKKGKQSPLEQEGESLAETPKRKRKIQSWQPQIHKCYRCDTILNSPKALRTCIGKHEEPCPRFHRTLHIIGETDKCTSCRTYKSMLGKRLAEIKSLEDSIKSMPKGGEKKEKEAKLQELKREHELNEANENEATSERKAGYYKWISRTKDF